MRPEAVIFDWGGTLSEFVPIELEDMWRLAARHLAPHMPEDEKALTARLMDIERLFWDRTSTDARAGSLADLLAEATTALGVDVGEALLEEAGVRYLDAWTPHIEHDPEAVATLEALRARGMRIGLLSNTHWPPTYHEHFLERDGLAGLIDRRLYTSEMEYMKPHPVAFRAALESVEVTDPARAVFVGDRLFDDIHGAQQAGMRAVHRPNELVPEYPAGYPGFRRRVEPDATITRLPELIDVIDRWSARDRE